MKSVLNEVSVGSPCSLELERVLRGGKMVTLAVPSQTGRFGVLLTVEYASGWHVVNGSYLLLRAFHKGRKVDLIEPVKRLMADWYSCAKWSDHDCLEIDDYLSASILDIEAVPDEDLSALERALTSFDL